MLQELVYGLIISKSIFLSLKILIAILIQMPNFDFKSLG